MEGWRQFDRQDVMAFEEKRSRLFLRSTLHVGVHWIAQLESLVRAHTPRDGFRLGNRRSKDSSTDGPHRAVVQRFRNWLWFGIRFFGRKAGEYVHRRRLFGRLRNTQS